MPSKGGHSRLMSSKLCLNLEGLERSFIFMVQRDPYQFVDLLLIGWWQDKWKSASWTFWVQLVWALCLWAAYRFIFFCLVGVLTFAKQLKDIVTCNNMLQVLLTGNQDSAPRLHACCSWLFLLCPQCPIPSLFNSCLNPPLGTQGRSWRLNEAYFLCSRRGDAERLLGPVPHRVLLSITWTEVPPFGEIT